MPQINEFSWTMFSILVILILILISASNFFFSFGKFKNTSKMILLSFGYMM